MAKPHPLTVALLGLLIWAGVCSAQVPSTSTDPGVSLRSGKGSGTGVREGNSQTPDQQDLLNQLDRTLVELGYRKADLSVRHTQLEKECTRAREEILRLRQDSERLRESVNQRLLALYKYRQMGYAAPILTAGAPRAALGAELTAAKILQADQDLLLDFRTRGTEVQRLEAVLGEKQKTLESVTLQIEAHDREHRQAREKEELLLAKVGPSGTDPARNDPDHGPPGGERRSETFLRKPIPKVSEGLFAARKGSLAPPVAGEIVGAFATKSPAASGSSLYKNGIIIRAPKGRPVRAIFDGTVVFADWLKDYGQVIIIDHGSHYHSLMAHADQLYKKVDDRVKAGEAVATVGATGSPDRPRLYFEIRYYGKPVDPLEWLEVRKFSGE